jgi:hypothetical protein
VTVLQHTPTLWDYRKKLNDKEDQISLNVFTTWEMSFQQIGGKEETDQIEISHFLTLSAFYHNLGIQEDMFKAAYQSTKTRGNINPTSRKSPKTRSSLREDFIFPSYLLLRALCSA